MSSLLDEIRAGICTLLDDGYEVTSITLTPKLLAEARATYTIHSDFVPDVTALFGIPVTILSFEGTSYVTGWTGAGGKVLRIPISWSVT